MLGICTAKKEGNLEKAERLALTYMQDVLTDEKVYPILLILELLYKQKQKNKSAN